MSFAIVNLILSILTFLTLVIYAYFTYLIAKDVYEPLVSFTFNQISSSHLGFNIINKSKVEVEVFGKLWSKKNNELFEFKKGFYGDEYPWILQPFTEGRGNFELKDIVNETGVKLKDFVEDERISSLKFIFQIKYKKVGGKKWKVSSPQKFIYDFNKDMFWLNV